MTEQEWLTSKDPQRMVAYITGTLRQFSTGQTYKRHPVATDRKLRLFGQAVLLGCDLGPFTEDWQGSQDIVEWVTNCAGVGQPASLLSHFPNLDRVGLLRDIIGNPFCELKVTGPNRRGGCAQITDYPIYDCAIHPWGSQYAIYIPIMGGRIYYAAQEIYQSCDFSSLGIIADMLEDTNAANAPILEHLRSPGPHVRGCWALDLILGNN